MAEQDDSDERKPGGRSSGDAGGSNPRRQSSGGGSERGAGQPRQGRSASEGRPAAGRKPYPKRDGERPSYPKRDGDRKPYPKRDGERPSYPKRDGERKPYPKRDGERPSYPKRDGDRRAHAPRAGREREQSGSRPDQLRSVRTRHDDPPIPEEITPRDLNGPARNELKTLSKENADEVARHLAMAAALIEDDPELAHQHAISASRRAGRIAVVRETLAITAYAIGDFALALRELRTYRRISGKDDQIALMVDSERGVGRPERALELGRSVERADLPVEVRVELAIAMSGARLDLGQTERALQELDIPELDPDRAFEWSPALFSARATVLEELGRDGEAAQWARRAEIAAEALDAAAGVGELEVIEVEEIDAAPSEVPPAERDAVEAGDGIPPTGGE